MDRQVLKTISSDFTSQFLRDFLLILPVSTAPSKSGSKFSTSSILMKRHRSPFSMHLMISTVKRKYDKPIPEK